MVINSFIYFSNEIIDSVKNVNVTLIDQLSIEEIQKENTNACLESQVNKEVSILQPPSSSDKPE